MRDINSMKSSVYGAPFVKAVLLGRSVRKPFWRWAMERREALELSPFPTGADSRRMAVDFVAGQQGFDLDNVAHWPEDKRKAFGEEVDRVAKAEQIRLSDNPDHIKQSPDGRAMLFVNKLRSMM